MTLAISDCPLHGFCPLRSAQVSRQKKLAPTSHCRHNCQFLLKKQYKSKKRPTVMAKETYWEAKEANFQLKYGSNT
jgi:hypothetical protein